MRLRGNLHSPACNDRCSFPSFIFCGVLRRKASCTAMRRNVAESSHETAVTATEGDDVSIQSEGAVRWYNKTSTSHFLRAIAASPPHQHTSVFSLVTSSISCCKRLLESPKFPFEVVGLPPGTSLQQQLPTVLYESGLYHWYYSPSRRLIASVNCRHFRPCNARARVGASARAPLINGGIK